MAIKLIEADGGKILEVQASGKLMHEDYLIFVPVVEQSIRRHGKVRLLFEMLDFHGWDAKAVWDDIKFDVKHFSDLERVAMVGDKKWQQGMSAFCKPFTSASVRYFDLSEIIEARSWLNMK